MAVTSSRVISGGICVPIAVARTVPGGLAPAGLRSAALLARTVPDGLAPAGLRSALLVTALGEPAWLPAVLGGLYVSYGTGVAVNVAVSVFGAYALPDTANPFAINTGAGVVKSLLTIVTMLATIAASMPYLAAVVLLGDTALWTWLALPTSVGYGLGAAVLGTWLAGDALDRRAPELLAMVTPR